MLEGLWAGIAVLGLGLRGGTGPTGILAGTWQQKDCTGLWEPVALWQGKSVRALPLCCGVRDAKPRAARWPEGGERGCSYRCSLLQDTHVCHRQETALSGSLRLFLSICAPSLTSWGRKGIEG